MKSKLLSKFEIPHADYSNGVPRLVFRSRDNQLVGLDLAGASQLRQKFVQAGSINEAYEVDRHIAAARRVAVRVKAPPDSITPLRASAVARRQK
jgi:hypothetical protein